MSDTNQPYDPGAPEGEAPRGSAYVSKRDFRVIVIGIVAFVIMLMPIYKVLERNSQKARCAQNMAAIANGIGQYAALHDDRFPPVMRTLLNGSPDLGTTGMPYTWASDVQEFMNPRANFLCPSAIPSEIVYVEGLKNARIPVTYGMYVPYGGYLRSVIDDPDQTIIVAETSNYGGADTFDPLPYVDLDGNKIPHDGFAIGFNDDNQTGTSASKYITRLAFPGTADGKFPETGLGRHDAGIHSITATGSAAPLLKPNDAVIVRRFELPGGIWTVPPLSKRNN
ncbi:MAG: hypothetical protein ACO1SV_23115 [Fimbriimonas sp.]